MIGAGSGAAGAGSNTGCAVCQTAEVTESRREARRPAEGPPPLTTAEIVAVTGGRLIRPSDRPVRGGAVDSRQIERGDLFVALPGERTDGHRFAPMAVRSGAGAALIREASPELLAAADEADAGLVAVPDTLLGLHAVAAAWRGRFSPLVVGVTGSIAKTSTKEAIAAVLAEGYRTLKSEGNQNNEVGLPLTVLRLGPEHEAAVLEMGMYVGGEIAQLAAIARPRIGVVTAVREVHLSRIGTIEAVSRAKAELIEALPDDGVAVLNADDPRVLAMGSRTKARSITYGFGDDADVRALDVESAGLAGMRFTLAVRGGRAGKTLKYSAPVNST